MPPPTCRGKPVAPEALVVTKSRDKSGVDPASRSQGVPSLPVIRTTVLVVTWRGADHIGACLDALAAQTRPHRVLVVDNASADGTAAVLTAHPSRPAVLRLARNTGYAGGLAAARVHSRFTAWLNDDAVPEPGWLAALEDALEAHPAAAAAAAVLLDRAGRVSSAGVRLTPLGYGVDIEAGEPFAMCGGAALVRTAAVAAVGGVPAGFFCYYEDVDTCWRLRLTGHRVLAVPAARARHIGGASARHGSAAFHQWNERNRLLMLLRCAPAGVAVRELARFAALTLLLPLRRDVPATPNFTVRLRLRVLGGLVVRLPAALAARARIGRWARVSRRTVWSVWAGR